MTQQSVDFTRDSLRFRCPDGHYTVALGRLARPVSGGGAWEFADRDTGPWRRCTQPLAENTWSDERDGPSAESSTVGMGGSRNPAQREPTDDDSAVEAS